MMYIEQIMKTTIKDVAMSNIFCNLDGGNNTFSLKRGRSMGTEEFMKCSVRFLFFYG